MVTIVEAYRRQRAEERFRAKLAQDSSFVSTAWEYRDYYADDTTEEGTAYFLWPHRISEELTYEIYDVAKNLDDRDRRRIEEALFQPSVRGRENYLRNLVMHGARTFEESRRGAES